MTSTPDNPDYKKWTPEQCYAWAERKIDQWQAGQALSLNPGGSLDSFALSRLPPNITGLKDLRSLDFKRTKVADLSPLANLNSLQVLYCNNTQVTDLSPLAKLAKLKWLNCSGTQVADLSPLTNLSRLQSFDCDGTEVADLSPLANLNNLETLDCKNTQVADLSPLANLVNLQTLDFRDSRVANLSPLVNLNKLETLDCKDTQVADLSPILGLQSLSSLSVSGCVGALHGLNQLPNLTELYIFEGQGEAIIDMISGNRSLSNLRVYSLSDDLIPTRIAKGNNCLPDLKTWIAEEYDPANRDTDQPPAHLDFGAFAEQIAQAVARAERGEAQVVVNDASQKLDLGDPKDVAALNSAEFRHFHAETQNLIDKALGAQCYPSASNQPDDTLIALRNALGEQPQDFRLYDWVSRAERVQEGYRVLLDKNPIHDDSDPIVGTIYAERESFLRQFKRADTILTGLHPQGQEITKLLTLGRVPDRETLDRLRALMRQLYGLAMASNDDLFSRPLLGTIEALLNQSDPQADGASERKILAQLEGAQTLLPDLFLGLSRLIEAATEENTSTRAAKTFIDEADKAIEEAGMLTKLRHFLAAGLDRFDRWRSTSLSEINAKPSRSPQDD